MTATRLRSSQRNSAAAGASSAATPPPVRPAGFAAAGAGLRRLLLPLFATALVAPLGTSCSDEGPSRIRPTGDVGNTEPDAQGDADDPATDAADTTRDITDPSDDTTPDVADAGDASDTGDTPDLDDALPDAPPSDDAVDTVDDTPGDDADDADADGRVPCADALCDLGTVCVDAQCVAITGRCDEGEPCQGDARCCGAECDDPGLCVAWGDGRTNANCEARVEIGLFEPGVQCEWTAPAEDDPWPTHVNVLSTPLVARLPYGALYGANIVFVSYNGTDGGAESGVGSSPSFYGVLRILDGETCRLIESVADDEHRIIGATTPAIADLDGDGNPDIVAIRAGGGLIAFRWDVDTARYTTWWTATETQLAGEYRWDGPALHDLDDDGFPEVISGGEVFDGRTGRRLNPGQNLAPSGTRGTLSVVADVDGDGRANLVTGPVYVWNTETSRWDDAYPGAPYGFIALGDFGTETPDGFDRDRRDGIPEIVSVWNNRARLATLSGRILLDVNALLGGGPPTVGDFDNDGRAEFSSAGGSELVVFDPDCTEATRSCLAPGVRWSRPAQDLSSRVTGSSIFDFDEDGQAEVVYADECYTRMYDGATGAVLYSSYRTSCTWYENPVIADVDGDGNSEIVVGSNVNCSVACPSIDPIHPGLRCEVDTDCPTDLGCIAGLCRCEGTDACTDDTICAPSLLADDPAGRVCRAFRPEGAALSGVRVLRDRLDRWASSREVWNQHTYAVTHIDDSLRVPRTSEWQASFAIDGPNAFRANTQGSVGATFVPDATVRHGTVACASDDEGTTLEATVCNRGWRPIGGGMPVRFETLDGTPWCTASLALSLLPATCATVACDTPAADVTGPIRVRANLDEDGRASLLECDADNNLLETELSACRSR